MNIYTSISELVGKTPLLEPRNYAQAHRLNARLLLKLDHLNPAGSMKDRIALAMINEAEASDRKSTRLNSSHMPKSRMPSSA